MASLGINYESSDEEDVVPVVQSQLSHAPPTATPLLKSAPGPAPAPTPAPAPLEDEKPVAEAGPINGPSIGPGALPEPTEAEVNEDVPPGSPYTSNRAMVQNLTLPTVPNFDIPSSPPGSPPRESTKKFAKFLDMKKKGQHFNQRLESSKVLRDPELKLNFIKHAGVDGQDQYASTLPEDVAVPTSFPDWAYFEELNASQKKLTKTKEGERYNKPREFVPATGSGSTSRSATPSARAPHQTVGKRKELEHRGGRDNSSSRSRRHSGSRSPKRRRSRSRDRR